MTAHDVEMVRILAGLGLGLGVVALIGIIACWAVWVRCGDKLT